MFNSVRNHLKIAIKRRIEAVIEPLIEKKLAKLLPIQFQVWESEHAPETERASYWEKQFDPQSLINRFQQMNVQVVPQQIDRNDFETWLTKNPLLCEYYQASKDVRVEKLLEHYLSWTHLAIQPVDIVIDIAAAHSPFAESLRQSGIRAYRQDLIYPAGAHGYEIGGDAGDLSLENEFADVLTLHCAFECFQGDADQRFFQTIPRILKPGGRVGIVPLYIDTIHFVKTSPWCDKREIQVEPEAKWLWRDDQWREPFSRHYSPESFVTRIVSAIPDIQTTILYFTNLHELSDYYPGQRLYCYFMFKGEKN